METSHRSYLPTDTSSVYKIPFSFHIKLASCLQENASPCTAIVSVFAFRNHCAFCAAPKMNGRLLGLIMRFRGELITYSTVYTMSD